jgi:hypothetical protein
VLTDSQFGSSLRLFRNLCHVISWTFISLRCTKYIDHVLSGCALCLFSKNSVLKCKLIVACTTLAVGSSHFLVMPWRAAGRDGNLKAGNRVDRHTRFLRFDPTPRKGAGVGPEGWRQRRIAASAVSSCLRRPGAISGGSIRNSGPVAVATLSRLHPLPILTAFFHKIHLKRIPPWSCQSY